ncbi:hypothetical protein V8C86DRAFT_2467237 [Haematococcus lacustris]
MADQERGLGRLFPVLLLLPLGCCCTPPGAGGVAAEGRPPDCGAGCVGSSREGGGVEGVYALMGSWRRSGAEAL